MRAERSGQRRVWSVRRLMDELRGSTVAWGGSTGPELPVGLRVVRQRPCSFGSCFVCREAADFLLTPKSSEWKAEHKTVTPLSPYMRS
jgi:hypothetical protein